MALLDVGSRGAAMPLKMLGSTPSIAILRAGGLGDFLSTTAALTGLRTSFPDASITLITSPFLAGFVGRYSEIDQVFASPPHRGIVDGEKEPWRLEDFFGRMRAESFDLALQWHGGGANSNPFVRRLGAQVTAGFRADDAEGLDYWLPYDLRQHEILRYLDLLTLLGLQVADPRTHLPVLPSDMEELGGLSDLVDLKALRENRYIGVHASAGGLNRRWSPERFAWVADRLLDEFDAEGVLVTAGPGQEGDSAAVRESMTHRDRAVDLGGRLSLGGLVGLISQLRLFLTNDSGPSHMAVALGTPSLVVFGAAHPMNWAPLNRTWHRMVANWESPCRWQIHDGCANSPEVSCLVDLRPEVVLEEARQLLLQIDRWGGPPSLANGAEARVSRAA